MAYKGIEYLKIKLSNRRHRVELRYDYYEMKNRMKDFEITMPKEYRWLKETLGWCGKSVDAIADRIVFKEFKDDNFNFNEIYNMNNKDVLIDSAVLGALISSCCFIYISPGVDGYPRMRVIDGRRATGIIDPITNLLIEGYAILEVDEKEMPTIEAYFTKEETVIYRKGATKPEIYKNPAPYPLLVPVIYRPDAKRPFGHSRISRACMSIMQGALRTLKRAEVSAEFYSFPQKYVTGLDPDAEEMNKWRATISTFLSFTKDSDGQAPTLGQFTQQSMTPYIDQIRMLASLFAGETGLTTDDLGFVSDNPSSSESIKASHENLRLATRKAQRNFSVGLINAGYLAACVRDNFPYVRNQIYKTSVTYEPIFEPDMSTLSLIGDGAIKINQAVPGYFGKNSLRELTGIEPDSDVQTPQPSENTYVKANEEKQGTQKKPTMYEITSLISKYKRGSITYNNALNMLKYIGVDENEAKALIDEESNA